MKKSHSYPEIQEDEMRRKLEDERKRHTLAEQDLKTQHNVTIEVLDAYKYKDQERTTHFANLGSPSSRNIIVHREGRCKETCIRFINYLLERSEEDRKVNNMIRVKSYAGFYYFLKWFIRTVVITFFTVSGNVVGKEIGCEIKSHKTCSSNAFTLWDNSPHLIASIFGSIFGLLIGQWLGRFIWDKSTNYIRKCLRKCEKCDDRSKLFLFLISFLIYAIGSASMGVIFWKFIRLIDNQIYNILVGCLIGGTSGLIMAGLAYRKTSPCISGDETPVNRPQEEIPDVPPIYESMGETFSFRPH